MKMFLLGILAMSAFSTISFIICDNVLRVGEAERELVDGGPVFWLVALFCWLIFKTKEIIRRAKYRGLLRNSLIGDVYRCRLNEYYLLFGYGWDYVDGDEFKDISTRSVPRKIWKHYPQIPEEVIKAAREESELQAEEW